MSAQNAARYVGSPCKWYAAAVPRAVGAAAASTCASAHAVALALWQGAPGAGLDKSQIKYTACGYHRMAL